MKKTHENTYAIYLLTEDLLHIIYKKVPCINLYFHSPLTDKIRFFLSQIKSNKMAKIKHHNFLNTVHEVFTDAKQAGVLHLYAGGESFSGRTIEIGGSELYHFGTTGYLGLEQDVRLKEAGTEAIERYGTQFPLSKSYISNPLYEELEGSISEMYQQPIIITKNSTPPKC